MKGKIILRWWGVLLCQIQVLLPTPLHSCIGRGNTPVEYNVLFQYWYEAYRSQGVHLGHRC